jgi:hypothetical protein
VTTLSKDNVRRRIASVEQALVARSQAGERIDENDVVRMKGNRGRAYDHQTGFQSGHVSDYQEGDWQKILTPEQQRRLDELIELHSKA